MALPHTPGAGKKQTNKELFLPHPQPGKRLGKPGAAIKAVCLTDAQAWI